MLQNQDFDKANFTPNEKKNDFFIHTLQILHFSGKNNGEFEGSVYLSLTFTVAVRLCFVVVITVIVNCYAFKK